MISTDFRKGTITRLKNLKVGNIFHLGHQSDYCIDKSPGFSRNGDGYIYEVCGITGLRIGCMVIDFVNLNDKRVDKSSNIERVIKSRYFTKYEGNLIVDKIDGNEYSEKRKFQQFLDKYPSFYG